MMKPSALYVRVPNSPIESTSPSSTNNITPNASSQDLESYIPESYPQIKYSFLGSFKALLRYFVLNNLTTARLVEQERSSTYNDDSNYPVTNDRLEISRSIREKFSDICIHHHFSKIYTRMKEKRNQFHINIPSITAVDTNIGSLNSSEAAANRNTIDVVVLNGEFNDIIEDGERERQRKLDPRKNCIQLFTTIWIFVEMWLITAGLFFLAYCIPNLGASIVLFVLGCIAFLRRSLLLTT